MASVSSPWPPRCCSKTYLGLFLLPLMGYFASFARRSGWVLDVVPWHQAPPLGNYGISDPDLLFSNIRCCIQWPAFNVTKMFHMPKLNSSTHCFLNLSLLLHSQPFCPGAWGRDWSAALTPPFLPLCPASSPDQFSCWHLSIPPHCLGHHSLTGPFSPDWPSSSLASLPACFPSFFFLLWFLFLYF